MKSEKNFAKKLRDLRTAKEMTQKQLAEEIGVTDQQIGKYESLHEKDRSIPGLDKVIKIADVFGVSIDELCDDCDSGTEKLEDLYDMVKYLNKLGERNFCTIEAEAKAVPLPVPEPGGEDECGNQELRFTELGVVIRIHCEALADFYKKRNTMLRLVRDGTMSNDTFKRWKSEINEELKKVKLTKVHRGFNWQKNLGEQLGEPLFFELDGKDLD